MIDSDYDGRVAGTCFADFGRDVVSLDKDARKIAALKAGRIPSFGRGRGHLVVSSITAGDLTPSTDFGASVTPGEEVARFIHEVSAQADVSPPAFPREGAASERFKRLDRRFISQDHHRGHVMSDLMSVARDVVEAIMATLARGNPRHVGWSGGVAQYDFGYVRIGRAL